jgi:hypothetical protein
MFATVKGTVKAIRKKSPDRHINDMPLTENPFSQKACNIMSLEQLRIEITCRLTREKGCHLITIEKNCMRTRVRIEITCHLRGCHSMTLEKICMRTQHNLRPWSLARYVASMQNFSLYLMHDIHQQSTPVMLDSLEDRLSMVCIIHVRENLLLLTHYVVRIAWIITTA